MAIHRISAVGRARWVVRISVHDPGLLELVKSLAADGLAAVRLVIFAVPLAHESHDVHSAEKGALRSVPPRFWPDTGQGQ